MSVRGGEGPFRQASRAALEDPALGAAIRKTAGLLECRRAAAVAGCPGFDSLRQWARERKGLASASLTEYAQAFARSARAAGTSVHFAADAGEAVGIAARIARQGGLREAVKAKSMTAEEVGLNEALETAGTRVTETDLGEYIIQLAGEKPSHILAPAIHRSREQVAELFTRELGAPPGADVDELIAWARRSLRERFLSADLGITGANFALADTGTVVLVTNEGNGRLAVSLPRTQISILGIDKIVPEAADLPGFLTLLTRSASGQTISSYVTLVTGPRRTGEEEGPDEVHVILLDNGRAALAESPFREMLHCLHCGSCLNHCPVYRAVGGHAYASPYPGPMGSVISPLLWGRAAYPDLPEACTLCGRCADVCPLRIPLPQYHRRLRHGPGGTGSRALARMTRSPAAYRSGLALARRFLRSRWLGRARRVGPLRAWSVCREVPLPPSETGFREWWAARTPPPVDSPPVAGEGVSRRPAPATDPGQGDGRSPTHPMRDLRAVGPESISGGEQAGAPTPGMSSALGRREGEALDGEGAPAPPASAERAEEARPLALYVGRARVAGVEVELLDRGSLPAKLARLLDDLGSPVTACPAQRWPAGLWEEVEAALRRAGCRVVRPEPAPGGYAWERESLSGAALGITPCEVYLAETGSLVFPAGAGQGTLASLLPPMHLALSVPGRCLRDLGEYLALPLALPSRLQLVTGPSRTGDIEGTLSTGVHGPGRVLHWIVGAA